MPRPTRSKPVVANTAEPLLSRKNYILLIVSFALILVAYSGMWIENEFDGFYALYIAPILLMGGYGLVAYGIFKRF
jgi:hypothetical protein